MLSASVTRESIAAAAEHGVNGYLAKPFTVQLLEKRVVALLQALPWDESPDPTPDAMAENNVMSPMEDDSGDDSWVI